MEIISISVDGVKVEGEIVVRTKHELRVRITSPYTDWEEAAFVPRGGMAALYFNAHPEIDFTTEYGDKQLEPLLTKLYQLGKFLEENRTMIKERLADTQKIDSDIVKQRQQLSNERTILKSKLKSGSIDNKTYQNQLKPISKAIKKLNWERVANWNKFYSCFPAEQLNRSKIWKIVRSL